MYTATSHLLASGLVALAVSTSVALLLVLTRRWHVRFTVDSMLHLPQKIHSDEIPRVGGLAIVAGFVAGLTFTVWRDDPSSTVSIATASALIGGLLPIFVIGFVEDVTKRINARQRLFWIAVGSVILIQARQVWLHGVDTPLLDPLFSNLSFAIAFSVFAFVGVANAYNIIDGLDGLLGGVSLITLGAIAWVAASLGDTKMFALACLLGSATLGFLPFNWPRARLFTGDGGAYALGFLTAAILLLLVQRHPGKISPWFGLTVAALPVWETLFSIWRRIRRGSKLTEPDQAHLHQLVRSGLHALIVRRAARHADRGPVPARAPNGACSPLLWTLHACAAALAATHVDDTFMQLAVFLCFTAAYGVLHHGLLRVRERTTRAVSANVAARPPIAAARASLDAEPPQGVAARAAVGAPRRKLLVLTPRYPYPVVGGDRLRIHEVCKALSRHVDLTLLSLCDQPHEMTHDPDDGVFARIERVWMPRWRSRLNVLAAIPTGTPLQLAYYRSPVFRARVDALLPSHDGALAHLIRTGQYLDGADVPVFLEMTDAISLNYARVRETGARAGLRAAIYALEAPRLLRHERAALARFDAVALVSRVDRDFLLGSDVDPRVMVCSNGIDLARMRWRPPGREPVLAFIGNMSSMQNMDACMNFAREALPLLRVRRPVTFRVIGRIGAADRERLAALPGVEVTGEVPDVARAAAGCIAGICSVRLAAGVQNKVLEYMALGLPVITTSIGLEGIDARPGIEVLVADTPQAFEEAVDRVIDDRELTVRLSIAGRRFVEQRADWDTQLAPFVDRIRAAIGAVVPVAVEAPMLSETPARVAAEAVATASATAAAAVAVPGPVPKPVDESSRRVEPVTNQP